MAVEKNLSAFSLAIAACLSAKWLQQIGLALLAAFFCGGASTAFPDREQAANGAIAPSVQSLQDARELMQQGREFFQAELFSAAVTVWQQAAEAFKASGENLDRAQALVYLSLAYQQHGKWPEATEAIAASLSLIGNSDRYQDSKLILAQALNAKGHLELALGRAETALKFWQEAAAIYFQIGDAEGAIGCQINQAQALQNLGLYRRARKTLEELELSLQNQPDSLIKATGLRSLGNTLRAIGELEKSRELLQQSLIIAQALRSPSATGAAQFSLGNTARALAKRAASFKQAAAAKAEIKAALEAYQKAAEISPSEKLRVQARLNQFSLLVDGQKFREAEAVRSLLQIDELPASRWSVYARINLAENLTKFSNALSNRQLTATSYPFAAAEDVSREQAKSITQGSALMLAAAVREAKSLKDPRAESYALGNLGQLYEAIGKSEEAEKLTQQALILAQGINASDIAYRWQWQLGRLLKKRGNIKDAIAAYSVAVETLQSLRKDLAAVNPDNPDVQFSFQESVEPVYRELVELLVSAEKEPSQENLRQARQIVESLQLAELENFFQEACLDAKPVQIDQLDANAAVIYPIILKNRLAVIVALPQSSLRLYTTLKPQREIESLLNELQQNIGNPAANTQEVLQLSQQVYDWTIRPAEAELKQKNVQTLVFVLDALLRNLPMAALHDGQQYLVEKYSVALTPGLQLLPPKRNEREKLEVLTAGLSEGRQGFSPLPKVKWEVEQIHSQVKSRVLLNRDFTHNNLKQALNLFPFPVVHIATHGQFSSQAEQTFILSWDGRINVKDLDNLLRREKQDLSRPIELLVFSACETAKGDSRAALGLAGVAVRAGARSTLATLWQVSDESTAALMVRFYQELVKESSTTKAEALRRAQLQILRQSRYSLPYYWAPYVLVGNWR